MKQHPFKKILQDKREISSHIKAGKPLSEIKDKYKFVKPIRFISLLLFICLSVSAQTINVHHRYYDLVFDTVLKQPISSTEWLTKAHLKENVKRGASFTIDPLIPARLQTNAAVYSHSGFDIGHLSCSADFRFSDTAQQECMYFSNCSMQQPQFNRTLWEHLEVYVRSLAAEYDSILVQTGCIYGSDKYKGYGVPMYYFKTLKYKGITEYYLGENKKPSTTDYRTMKVSADMLSKLGVKL